jgi:hypothetical protein
MKTNEMKLLTFFFLKNLNKHSMPHGDDYFLDHKKRTKIIFFNQTKQKSKKITDKMFFYINR